MQHLLNPPDSMLKCQTPPHQIHTLYNNPPKIHLSCRNDLDTSRMD